MAPLGQPLRLPCGESLPNRLAKAAMFDAFRWRSIAVALALEAEGIELLSGDGHQAHPLTRWNALILPAWCGRCLLRAALHLLRALAARARTPLRVTIL